MTDFPALEEIAKEKTKPFTPDNVAEIIAVFEGKMGAELKYGMKSGEWYIGLPAVFRNPETETRVHFNEQFPSRETFHAQKGELWITYYVVDGNVARMMDTIVLSADTDYAILDQGLFIHNHHYGTKKFLLSE